MIRIIEDLKNNQIIHSQGVRALKTYIRQKYPHESADATADIFADAVHKIIDNNIIHFDPTSRISIKRNLLKEISQKRVLEINAFEVFQVCTKLYDTSETYIEQLTTWINHNQSQVISVDEVIDLTNELFEMPTVETIDLSLDRHRPIDIVYPVEIFESATELQPIEIPEPKMKASIDMRQSTSFDGPFETPKSVNIEAPIDDQETLSHREAAATNKPVILEEAFDIQEPEILTVSQQLRRRLAVLDEETRKRKLEEALAEALTESSAESELLTIEPQIELPEIDPIEIDEVKTPHQNPLSLMQYIKTLRPSSKFALTFVILLVGCMILLSLFKQDDQTKPLSENSTAIDLPTIITRINQTAFDGTTTDNHLPDYLQYREINLKALQQWLKDKNSILADEVYLNNITTIAKKFNINPLLLFAITGQEQAFVPKESPDAHVIANNPFNVFGSWETYNTNIKDTAQIAAKTILTLSKDCPQNEDYIKWINRKYAEDENWHIGVASIFSELEKATTFE